ncbi:hypothetical protein BD410DRAFT_845616 [Rickenella mellea]|uniref:BHLH domain-containing protein n=1 Tax=Rickenella mellea TaxID=50990 RepID=A0A4Y7PHR3_9AGAM|nr:hypothetical protein BD410DRAFT_845616 [Rickenella mellea]
MSIHAADTPSSTTGSTAGSPPATLPPPTPHSPNTTNPMSLPSAIDSDNNSGSTNSAGNAAQPSNGTAPPKRKAGRRANTAERRATHNAVERQRRETLNGRFLDLAALLPNLATVRRPSKSAIVNSSIALIHSNRRQRLIAARELRLLKVETDALRRELNEWRDRSGLPRVDEPARAPEFLNLLSLGESELGGTDGSGENWWENSALDEMGEEERKAYELVMGASQEEDGEDGIEQGGEEDEYARGIVMMKNANSHQHAGALAAPGSVNLQHILPRGVPPQHMHNGMMQQHQHQHQQHQQHQQHHHHHAPAIASPTGLGFDPGHMGGHPAIHGGVNTMYEPNGHPHPHSHALPVHPNFMHAADSDVEKVAAWNAQLYNALGHGGGVSQAQWAHQLPAGPPQQQQQHHGNNTHVLFTPPGTAGSNASNEGHSPHPLVTAQAQVFLSNLHQQQQRMHIPAIGHGHVYTSPERDDASSVGSVDGTSRSSGGSPQPVTVRSNYEVVSPVGGGGAGVGVGYARRPSLSLNVPSIVGGSAWNGQSPPGQPMSAGGRHYAPVAGVMI